MFAPPIKVPSAKLSSQSDRVPAPTSPQQTRLRPRLGQSNQAVLGFEAQTTANLTGSVKRGVQERGRARTDSSTAAETTSWDFGKIPLFAPAQPVRHLTPSLLARPKLAIGQTSDPLEHEADRIADQVLGRTRPELSITQAPPRLSRKCACGGGCPKCTDEQGDRNVPGIVNEVLRSTGRPLDLAVRSFMEVQFGHDFSRVRIHDDGTAAASAAAVRAKAYTVGSHVVFGAGYYSPGSSGKRLLAHELAHVVQQSRGGAAPPLAPGAAHETDAARAAAAVGGGSPVQVSAATGVGLACDNDPDVEAALKRLEEQEGSPEPNQPTKPTRQNALKPDELIDEHVFGPRVHEEVGDLRKRLANREARLKTNPNDKALQAEVSKMRVHLRTLEGSGLDPGARGANVPGVGNINTRAAIQVIGPDGKIIALERGSWGPNHHAEGDALAKLRMRLGTQKLPAGTRIMVGGNQVVCGEVCKPDIAQFAHDYGVPLENVSASVRTRPKVVGQGQASGKTTERTGLRGDVPKATVQTEPLFPGGKEPPTQPPLPKGPAVPKAPPQPKTPPVAATTTHEPLAGEVAPPKQAPISAPPTAVPSHPEEAKIPGPKGHNRGLPNAGSPAATPKLQADKVMPPQSAPRSASKPVLSPPKVAARPSESVHVPAATMPAGRSNSSKEIGTAIAIEALFIIVELALQRWVQQSFAKDLQAHAEKMVQDQLTAERGRLEAAVMARQPEITDWQAHGIGAVLFVELEMDWQSTDIGAVLMKVSLPRLAVAKQGEIGLAPRRPDMSIRRYFVDLSNQMVGRSVDHQIVQILLEGTGY